MFFLKSLYTKVNLTILIAFVIALFLFNAALQKRLKDDATDFTKKQAKYLTEMLENNIKIDMLGYCERKVQDIVDYFADAPDIETIRIFDVNGIIKYSINHKEVGFTLTELDRHTAEVANKSGNERYAPFEETNKPYRSFCIIKDIENQEACYECHGSNEDIIASINLCMTMKTAEEQIEENQKINLQLIIFTVIIVTIVLSLLLTLLVNRPIKRIIKTMTGAEKGNLSVRVKVKTKDELGILGDQFNSMLTKLEKANKDISKYHQEQLLRVGRLATVGEMAAGIAHEIKNPLAGLAGATQILEKEFPSNDPRKEITEEMLKLINRLDKIIRDLLTYSRETKPELIVSNVNEEVEKVLFFIDKQAKSSQITITKHLDGSMPRILIDPERVQQVFLNIVLNALHAMPRGGTLNVTSNMEVIEDDADMLDPGIYVVISFKDSGEGIPEDILQKIFKPFFTTKTQGTGLGLSISQKIIEEHMGKLIVESKEGIGSIFKIYLPKRYS
jgi:signal transduction histidine kinase